jgi:hypothetical protein
MFEMIIMLTMPMVAMLIVMVIHTNPSRSPYRQDSSRPQLVLLVTANFTKNRSAKHIKAAIIVGKPEFYLLLKSSWLRLP